MLVEDVRITNFPLHRSEHHWKEVESKPDELLIEGTFHLKLSWSEYQKMLQNDAASRSNQLKALAERMHTCPAS